jgi:FixJ family two-component response regulator
VNLPLKDSAASAVGHAEELARLPVIFITGQEGLESGARALGAGCLKKPFAVDALLDLVGRNLREQR